MNLLKAELMPVSIVMVNYNSGSYLIESVSAALKQAQEIIVVDNNSSDSSLDELVARFPHENNLHTVKNKRNLGFASGCNIGLSHVTQPYILFLNPDCVLKQNCLYTMMKTLVANKSVGMVGGLLVNVDGTEQAGGRRAVPTPWRSFVRAFGLHKLESRWPRLFFDFHLHKQKLPKEPTEVEAISGALMLFKKQVLTNVGLMDEGYFLHCEDLDICMRFRQEQWRILFVPGAKALHYRSVCSKNRPIFVEWHKHKGMIRFYKKYFRHQYPGVVMWMVVFGVWLRFSIKASYFGLLHVSYALKLSRKKPRAPV